MALFRTNIEWADSSDTTIVYKYPFKNDGREVNNKSSLTVRESQMAVFVYKGKVCDVFAPGFYKLDTNIYPILTKLAAWQYGFETPITLDVYFVNTKQFTGNTWGTSNPILMKDSRFGNIRVRGFGRFAFKVDDCGAFLRELFGTNSSYKTEDIVGHLRSLIISTLADTLGESGISALDLAANTLEFQEAVTAAVQDSFKEIGLKLTKLIIENMSVPEEVEKAFDERTKLGILGDSTDVMMKVAAAEAMKKAAENEGAGGAFMGAGVGAGAGIGMGAMMGEAMRNSAAPSAPAAPSAAGAVCPVCKAAVPAGSKFCPNCGAKMAVASFCPGCGKSVPAGSKFCPDCGAKL